MSSNETPEARIVLQALAHNIHAGQLTHQVSVGLLHHLAAGMDAKIKALEGDPAAAPGSAANKGSQLLFRDCVDATEDAEAALVALSNGPVKDWLTGYRKIMQGIHGTAPDAGWVAAGFPPGSTAIPRGHDGRLALLAAARAYLAAHATYEASLPGPSGPPLAITAAAALTLQTNLQTARTLGDTRAAEQATCKAARDVDYKALYKEVSELISELRDLLEDEDPRWEVFGLNIPANPSAPEAVASLTITAAGPGRELAEWPYARRANRYRVFLKRIGTDDEFKNVDDAEDLNLLLKDLTPASTIEVYVVAAVANKYAPPSPIVSKVVGA